MNASEYTSMSPLVHIDGTFNSDHYVSVGLRPMAIPFIQDLLNATDNARPHVPFIRRLLLGCTFIQDLLNASR